MSKVYSTSSALNAVPSWSLTSRRRWKTYVVTFGRSHRSASAGTILRPESKAVSLVAVVESLGRGEVSSW
jgi:hypothetical protein